ncbi:hypothetical protein TYRP_017277 [Tyrophagus putrescentiae]|nr:hypothetical protein TYRP_017277 [Tyrophagus putrescentiae]
MALVLVLVLHALLSPAWELSPKFPATCFSVLVVTVIKDSAAPSSISMVSIFVASFLLFFATAAFFWPLPFGETPTQLGSLHRELWQLCNCLSSRPGMYFRPPADWANFGSANMWSAMRLNSRAATKASTTRGKAFAAHVEVLKEGGQLDQTGSHPDDGRHAEDAVEAAQIFQLHRRERPQHLGRGELTVHTVGASQAASSRRAGGGRGGGGGGRTGSGSGGTRIGRGC